MNLHLDGPVLPDEHNIAPISLSISTRNDLEM